MKMISKFLIILSIACIANAATATGSSAKKSAHQEGCYIEEIKKVIPFGTRVNPIGYCYTVHCENSSKPGAFMISKLGCGDVATVNKNCHLTETDLTKPYPECCPYFKCD